MDAMTDIRSQRKRNLEGLLVEAVRLLENEGGVKGPRKSGQRRPDSGEKSECQGMEDFVFRGIV